MTKRINNIEINPTRFLKFIIDSDDYVTRYTVEEVFFTSSNIVSSYNLTRTDDYNFYSIDFEDDEGDRLSYPFGIDHPLYIPLLNLLQGDKELIIDDDATSGDNQKYIKIYLDKGIIFLDFINNVGTNDTCINKYSVFVKNVFPDLRSKVDQQNKDTKLRLKQFFEELCNTLGADAKDVTQGNVRMHEKE